MKKGINLTDIKNWNSDIEKTITERWYEEERFRLSKKTKKKIYSIDTPPPYVNSAIHIGQAITYCYMDFFARFKRMCNNEVLFPLGLDRNGLPIEMATEKKFNVSPFKIGRDRFIELCEQLLKETSTDTIKTFSRLGISFTSYKEGDHIGAIYKTDAPEYRALTQATFINLYKKGLIYEATRINNWDPVLQTTIADSEIEYRDLPSTFNDIIWKVKETGEKIIIGTTRPELICTCGMVIYHPTDKRYAHLKGKHAITPLFNTEVPIQPHSLADPEKGTGLVMMCSAGDLSDIQFFREMHLTPVIAINKDGTMNEHASFLQGLPLKKAREQILLELERQALLVKQREITHRTPVSERSGAEIEFIAMPEFYLKQLEFREDLKKIAKKIEFHPPEALKILENWIDSIVIDWPISRRRYYATPIPLWYHNELTTLPPPGKYYQPWKEKPPRDSLVMKKNKIIGTFANFKSLSWKGEERVFDTWMDSSISPLFILNYQQDNPFFEHAYPATLRPQGKEIIRTWLYYTLLRCYLETKKPCFKNVWINQHILDEKGRKMSKSLGNAIDPQTIIKEDGAESLRLWAAIEGDLTKQDFLVSREKIRAEAKTINKLLNMTRFILQFKKPTKKPTRTALDLLFIAHSEDLTLQIREAYDRYNFHQPALKLREYLWETFASHYLELVKSRAYNEQNQFTKEETASAHYTLHTILERLIILFYPIIPQLTTVIGNALKIDPASTSFPTGKQREKESEQVNILVRFNKLVWKSKQEKGISLREPLQDILIPKELKDFEKDLKACHKI